MIPTRDHRLRPAIVRLRPTRGAGILPVTLGVVLLVAVLLALSSERMLGVRLQQSSSAARTRAACAAESVAALHESALLTQFSNNAKDDFSTLPTVNWGVDRFGSSLVRWRIDPLRLQQPLAVPPPAMPAIVQPIVGQVPGATDPAYAYVGNPQLWCYRVASDAYALTDTDPGAFAEQFDPGTTPYLAVGDPLNASAPWNDPRHRVAHVQAMRNVVFQTVPLTDYAIFYAASGALGNCEIWSTPTNPLTVARLPGTALAGSAPLIHANADILIGRAGSGDVTVGDATFPAEVTAAGEVMRQTVAPVPDAQDGTLIINTVGFTTATDSVSATWMTAGVFGNQVRDQDKGVRPVMTPASARIDRDTDSTIGAAVALASQPFEYDREVGPGVGLYDRDGAAGTTDYTAFPIIGTSQRLFYTSDPQTIAPGASATTTLIPTPWPVFATGMKLITLGAVAGTHTPAQTDVWPDNTPLPAAPVLDAFAWPQRWTLPAPLATRSVLPPYFRDVVDRSYGASGRSGLAIVERGNVAVPLVRPIDYAAADWLTRYTAYLAARYTVMFYGNLFPDPQDITSDFFAFCGSPASNPGNDWRLLCAEEWSFHDRRIAESLVQHGLLSAAAAAAFQVDVMTINWDRVVAYLTLRGWNDRFSGVVYACRAPLVGAGGIGRVDPTQPYGYHPVTNPRPRASGLIGVGLGGGALVGHPSSGTQPYAGPSFAFPATKAIRLAQASSIGYGVGGWAPGTEGIPSGLMLITPDHCYLQGSINTIAATVPAGQPTCLICADGVTALSDGWLDAANQSDADPLRAAVGATAPATVLQRVALCVNNVPTVRCAASDSDGSGGVVGVVRFLENWTGVSYRLDGSLAVLGEQRYSPGRLGDQIPPALFIRPAIALTYDLTLRTPSSPAVLAPFCARLVKAVSTVHFLE